MILKVFTQPTCPACPPAKELARKLENHVQVEYIDVSEPNGLDEAMKYNVMATPTLILVEKEVKKVWTGTPDEKEVLEAIKSG